MNIKQKAVSIGASAALLASLMATAVAPVELRVAAILWPILPDLPTPTLWKPRCADCASRTRPSGCSRWHDSIMRAMHTLARRQGRSLQALMAEAFNDVLRKHGESPIGN